MDKQGLLQLLSKADSDLVSYQVHIDQAEKAVAAAIAELDAIGVRSDGRQQTLHLADQTVRQLQSELDQARTRATLAQGTLADTGEVSTKDLERRLQKAERDLAALSTRLAKEEIADAERARSAQANREKYETQLDYFQRQQETLSRVKEQAQRDLGECEQREIITRLNDLQSNLADKEDEVTRARAALDDFADEAKQVLADWPDLLREVLPHLAYRDNTTHVLEAALQFVITCLCQGKDAANIDSDVFRQAGLPWSDLFSLLSFEQAMYYGVLKGDDFPARLSESLALQERKKAIEKVLAVYREMKR